MSDTRTYPPPSWNSRLLNGMGRGWQRLTRWRISGSLPDIPRYVIIVAPHTSNWDFPHGLAAAFALDLKPNWIGKHTLFRGPFGALFRALGGIAVDRSASTGLVGRVADQIQSGDRGIVAIAPEGTRKAVDRWRTGFYHIAREADVPILPVRFDYEVRTIDIRPPFRPTGDVEKDIAALQTELGVSTGTADKGRAG